MMRIILNGANGRMGRQVQELLRERGVELDAELAACVDQAGDGVYAALTDYAGPADVILDFSFHTSAKALASYAAARALPLVVATTGHTEEELGYLHAAAEQVPVFHAANLSMGIALLIRFAKQAAAAFPDADIEVVEAHHNRKQDAPSGTALTIARAMSEARPGSPVQVGREGFGRRIPGEITVHALRMGNIAGQHEVFITTDHQQLSIRHEAYDRVLLAEGGIQAARFLLGKPARLYGMEDLAS